METADISLLISAAALSISVWTRVDAWFSTRRQRKWDRAKKAGEALVSAQRLKNQLSDCKDELKLRIDGKSEAFSSIQVASHIAMMDLSQTVDQEYKDVWELVASLEQILMAFERGESPHIDETRLEAKIARFNQRRELAEFDMRYLSSRTAG